jgi:polyphosphate kinase
MKQTNRSGRSKSTYVLIEIPSDKLPRFIELPASPKKHYYIFLDDIIRLSLPQLFPGFEIVNCYSVKLTRDAELYIDDEFTGNLLSKIQKGIKKRSTGVPSRFLYDLSMPKTFLKYLSETLGLTNEDIVAGGRYHNFNDLFTFPNPGKTELENPKQIQLQIGDFENCADLFNVIKQKDIGLHFPYHSYSYVVSFLSQAADDPDVQSIKITQYRVAKDSAIVNTLIRAAKKGKEVIAFVELKARFDEEQNIHWAEQMEKHGVKVFYSFPGLKVHAKTALISRKENGELIHYCYLSTGNFNEKTAKIYSDFGMFTSDMRLTSEVEKVFQFLSGKTIKYKFKHLLVAQFNMRKKLTKLIQNEIDTVKNGGIGKIILKLNSIEDKKMINKLYEASNAGLKIYLIVRGICCLTPGITGLSENIKVVSIIDKYLEHARFFIFHNEGNQLIYAASADWMKRNLSRRVEVGFPVYQQNIKDEINKMIEIQLKDNSKARVLNSLGENSYFKSESQESIRSQIDFYYYLQNKLTN